jgi:hypothetical protein
VPSAAIFIVRSMSDPAPRELSRDANAHVVPAEWSGALRRQLDDLYQAAVRPASGFAARSALAVVFRDPAELIACLTRDFLNGALAGCWWWEAWLRAASVASIDDVIDAWMREARHVPAAAAMLRREGLAGVFARSLTSRQARMLLVAIAEAYEAPALVAPSPQAEVTPLPVVATAEPGQSSVTLTPAKALDAEAPRDHVASVAPPSPPWSPFVDRSAVPASLDIEQQTFLGVALALWHAPVVARTRAFARDLHVWREYTVSRRSADIDRPPPRRFEPDRADLRERTAAKEVPTPIERPAPTPQIAPGGEPPHRQARRRALTPTERIAGAMGSHVVDPPNIQFLPVAARSVRLTRTLQHGAAADPPCSASGAGCFATS